MQNIMPISDASESDHLYYGQFPHDFKFGTSTVAEQVEGTWNGDGKGLSVWDQFSQSHPKCIADRSTAKEACDSYRRFEDDVILLKSMHANTYSFTLNWARLCPDGTCHNVNEKGVEYYDDLINTLVENGIEPIVTLYHTDMPQCLLQNHAGGWMNESLISEFESFARLCFERFGNRVQQWVTIAQPWVHSWKSYGDGTHPPSICLGTNGASLALGNLLKAHLRVYQMYEDEFSRIQNGRVGISLRVKDDEDEDCLFQLERVLSPIVAERRPKYCTNTDETWASASSRQNFDFLAIHFSPGTSSSDSSLTMLKLLRIVKEKFGNPKVLVFCEGPQLECPSAQVMDTERAQYFSQVANQVLRAMDLDECNVEGFLPGKLMDCWEFEFGYTISYGLHHVNFAHPSKRRSPRASVAFMLKQLFKLKHFEHADVI